MDGADTVVDYGGTFACSMPTAVFEAIQETVPMMDILQRVTRTTEHEALFGHIGRACFVLAKVDPLEWDKAKLEAEKK